MNMAALLSTIYLTSHDLYCSIANTTPKLDSTEKNFTIFNLTHLHIKEDYNHTQTPVSLTNRNLQKLVVKNISATTARHELKHYHVHQTSLPMPRLRSGSNVHYPSRNLSNNYSSQFLSETETSNEKESLSNSSLISVVHIHKNEFPRSFLRSGTNFRIPLKKVANNSLNRNIQEIRKGNEDADLFNSSKTNFYGRSLFSDIAR